MAGRRMGLPTGVEFIGKSIRIRFTWNGERRSETLAYPQTAKGIKAASDLRAQVVSLAKHGALDDKRYAELFPNSSYIGFTTEVTFGTYAQTWLNSLEIVPGTRLNYLGTMNKYWMPHLATKPMTAITPMILRQIINSTEWGSQTIKRTSISRINALFKSAIYDEVIERNPAGSIQLPLRVKKTVEPFSSSEAEAIVAWMRSNFRDSLQIYAAYFEFAFYSGMRTGEMMALRWDEVDMAERTAHVCRIVVGGKVEERTKTKYARVVMLNSRALSALADARMIADARAVQRRRKVVASPYVFHPSGRSEHMLGSSTPGAHFAHALNALGIKPRPQYNCRHTYATMCLMAGVNPAFIAGQLGHSVQVLLSTYARWLNSPNDWGELGKLEMHMNGTKLVQG